MAPPDDTEDFAALLAEFDQKPRRRDPQVGERVRGKVASIGRDAVFLDLGGKSEGMIDSAELRDEEGKLQVKLGDTLEARVVEIGGKAGCIVLRRQMGRGPDAAAEVEQAFALGIPVEGLITGTNKGGVEVQVAGMRGFCPISQLSLRHIDDATPFVGERMTFRITRLEKANLVLSRRALLEEEEAARAETTRARLVAGAVLRGTVTSIKDYGAFVDLGGIEGMLHVSELGFARVAHPGDVLRPGQEIEVAVLKIEKTGDPKRPEKISLSLKSLADDPWELVPQRFPEGARATGKVTRIETFGAFVEIAPGVEGLLHVSELGAGRRVNHARQATKVGATLEVVVLGVDAEKRRLSLGLSPEGAGEDAGPLAPSVPQRLGTFADLLRKGR
jgi:small subunit ribosomal protein S1